MNLLAADIGATNSRFAWVDDNGPQISEYPNAGFADLYQVIERFLGDRGKAGVRIKKMVLALPGPPDAEVMRLTNIDWVVARERLMQSFNVAEVILLNDFQAAALGAIHSEGRVGLNPVGERPRTGTAVVTGAGTGLGLAWCADIADCTLPVATEGGHVDFAPANEEQYALHRWLARSYGHVSCERVLSGDGLEDTYRSFAGADRDTPTAAGIVAGAARGEEIAGRVVACFVSGLAQYAGNLALQFNPAAGVYLCGGVVGHLTPWIRNGFATHYLDKGRMREQVAAVPAYLVEQQNTGLLGAIRIARGV